ncbi:MAG: patatin-like phospholipase family protein [Flavobacteriaceae bacterium]|jgi:NTE family protein|nr:patatin-like phospholipase family protein [Flavobacteriaceae bacterium]
MKPRLSFFALLIFFFSLKSQVKDSLLVPEQPKIGLSLSGGGAKGFAHVGVLKVIDSLGIKIDYIAGTSMGAIVGGLYASGYSAKEIENVILKTDFYNILANEKTRRETSFFSKSTDKYLLTIPVYDGKFKIIPKAFSKGQKNIYLLKELFKNVSSTNDFSKLPIPFLCVATNLESGKTEIFEKGDLVNSIMASSAFPSLLDPVKIGDSLYIDGAVTLNYPSKPLKDKGIDIVIGVDLNQGLASADNLNSLIDILNQVIDFGIQKETKNQYQYTDINIHPDLSGLSATSYNDKIKILDSGFVAAKKFEAILSQLPKRDSTTSRFSKNLIYSNIYNIDSLQVTNNLIFNKSYVQGKLGLKIPSSQTYANVNKMIDKLYATNNYNLINYDLISHDENYLLKLDVQEDNTRLFLKFGLHYDDIFNTGLLINITAKRLLFRNAIFSFDGVVGDMPRYYFNYFIDNGYIPGFGIYASGMRVELEDSDSDVYENWIWFRNDVYIQSVWRDKYAIGGGLSHDYFERQTGIGDYYDARNYINPYVFLKSDTQNDKDFPTRGFFLNAEGKIIDLLNSEIEKKTLQTKAKIAVHIPIFRRFTYSLNLFGGFTIGNPYQNIYYKYGLGGMFEQNLVNFADFEGYNFGQIFSDNLLTMSNRFRVRFYKNFFATGSVNFVNYFDDLNMENALRIKETSLGITLGYRSPFGQIKINYGQSVKSKKGMFNVVLGHWF